MCQATPLTNPTLAEHEKWCASVKPTAERIAEIKAGAGPVMLAGELEWLGGDASRAELHISGAAAGAFPLSDDLPGWIAELGRKLGAAVAELDRTRSALAQSENDLTGARLDRWEEEQVTRRLRLALQSAKRGRAAARETDAKRLKLLRAVQKLAHDRGAEAKGRAAYGKRLEARVAELEAEQHSTNEALDDAVKAIAEKTEVLALAVVLEIPRPGVAAPLQLRLSDGHSDRWAICDRTGRRWYPEGWMHEPMDDRLCDDGRFTLAEALPLARKLAKAGEPA